MLTRKELQYYASLNKKKFRESESQFLVEGKRIVEEGINSNLKPEIIFVTDEFYSTNFEVIDKLKSLQIRLEKIGQTNFNKIADTKNPQGIAAVFHKKEIKSASVSKNNIVVALESISDPGNLGTILRTCAWFGIYDIIISPDTVDLYNPKVIRSSMGAIFHLQIRQATDFFEELIKLKNNGYSISFADVKGENIFNFKPKQKVVITFCNEANGASEKLAEICDSRISIPKLGEGESLNVAAAAAVIISHIKNR